MRASHGKITGMKQADGKEIQFFVFLSCGLQDSQHSCFYRYVALEEDFHEFRDGRENTTVWYKNNNNMTLWLNQDRFSHKL